MINYILQVVLFQILFLAIYDFFLSKETFFTKNRIYLLVTPILSFLIPLIKIPNFQKAVSQELVISLPEIILNPDKVMQQTILESNTELSINIISILFWIGVGLFFILFLSKLMKIIRLTQKHQITKQSDFTLIVIPNQIKAFSFFNYIFLGEEISEFQKRKIIQHELIHCKQKHTYDLLFFEIFKIVMWFNPMIYIYQKRITLVHEYISDAKASKTVTKESYINDLLTNYFHVENIDFVNQFYKESLLKKRISMMTKEQSKKMNQLKYLLLIPVLVSMLFYVSCSSVNNLEKRIVTHYRIADGELFSYKGDKESYLDTYFGIDPKGFLEEIPFDELPLNIKQQQFKKREYYRKKYKNRPRLLNELIKLSRFFKTPDGRIAVGTIGSFNSIHPDKIGESLLFIRLEKTPIFPGCKDRDSDCFIKKIEQHFTANFDKSILKNLDLNVKKVKVNIDFNINTEGYVDDINVKAPHRIIEQEAVKAIASLPKMTAGEKYGKPIKAKYILPFTILLE